MVTGITDLTVGGITAIGIAMVAGAMVIGTTMVDGVPVIGTTTAVGTTMAAGATVIGTTIEIRVAERARGQSSSSVNAHEARWKSTEGCVAYGESLAPRSASDSALCSPL
jgi:hypothetical protein